jgi:hypothetical protein
MGIPNSVRTFYNTSVLSHGFLEIYKQLMYCHTVLPFFLQYLINKSESMLIIASNFMYGINLQRTLDKILYKVGNSDIPLGLMI